MHAQHIQTNFECSQNISSRKQISLVNNKFPKRNLRILLAKEFEQLFSFFLSLLVDANEANNKIRYTEALMFYQ